MSDAGRTVAFSFAFQRPLDSWARWFAVVPTRSYVRVDDHGFEAVYGPWRVATVWSNVVGVERTGPYRAWKVAGPAHLSWADRGITMAATTACGACLRFRDPVRGIDPLGVIRHSSATLGVDDVDRFLRMVEDRIEAAASMVGSAQPPDHREGRYVPALRAVWKWNRRRVAHDQRSVDRIEMPARDRAEDVDDQPVEVGAGPTFHRCYRTAVRNGALGAEAAMARIQADPNVLADLDLAPFTKVRGVSGEMRVGDRYVIEITGPWKGAVEVIEASPRALRLATMEGHMESGVIEMRTSSKASINEPAEVAFTIESWARSHDRFLDVMYDKLGIAKALQSEMWSVACDRFAQLVQGEQVGPLDVVTERAS
ncbi:MAG: hypothetical protein ACRDZ2_14705 [Ilumatobacteraceae bacterium]